jgi:hypothetical protein
VDGLKSKDENVNSLSSNDRDFRPGMDSSVILEEAWGRFKMTALFRNDGLAGIQVWLPREDPVTFS